MRNFYEQDGDLLDTQPGAQILDTIREAIVLAEQQRRVLRFDFNGVMVSVCGHSDPDLLYRDFHRATNGYIDKAIGPHPRPELSAEETGHDQRIEAENEAKRQERHREWQERERQRSERIEARLVGAPGIELAAPEAWKQFVQKNSDSYGGAVVTYAERWARLMQLRMAEGAVLADIADEESHEADLEGITGFMYGCAVAALARTWKHGEALRRWHNLKTQIGTEGEKANESGGVLNPALLSIEEEGCQ